MSHPRTPVLVGVAQYVDRDSAPTDALSPIEMLARVAVGAIADSGVDSVTPTIDTVAVVRMFADSSPLFRSPFGSYSNLPRSLAKRLNVAPRSLIYGPVGGNSPQMLVNILAERIASGEANIALIAGVEALRTQARAQKAGVRLDWSEDTGDAAEEIEPDKPLVSRHELAHGIALPVNVYPLFENAIGHRHGRTPIDHRYAIGQLMAPFTEVATNNPYAALPIARSPHELVEPSDDNRYIGYPYTKYLNSNMFVDQAAAVLLMSSEAADRCGVPADRRVYLHGSADVSEKLYVSDRLNYWESPAIRVGATHALASAGVTVADLDYVDLYSCFPSAVEIAADAIGIDLEDPRGLTLTGGLPYFGGPGNNYSLHAIAEVVGRCRSDPGSYGFVFANGGYLTKHSFGVYSTAPTNGTWTRADPAGYQRDIDAMPSPLFTTEPDGAGRIETFTVVFDRGKPAFAILVGRLDEGDVRFLAQMHEELEQLIDKPAVGRRITVQAGNPVNRARFV